jgi:hypothetical protein
MGKRFLFYMKGHQKPITITDSKEDKNIPDLVKEITNSIASSPVIYFSTDCDGILLRSCEISGVCITNIEKYNKKKFEEKNNNVQENSDLSMIEENEIEYEEEHEEEILNNDNKIIEDDDEEIEEDILNEIEEEMNNIENNPQPKNYNINKQKKQQIPSTNDNLDGIIGTKKGLINPPPLMNRGHGESYIPPADLKKEDIMGYENNISSGSTSSGIQQYNNPSPNINQNQRKPRILRKS